MRPQIPCRFKRVRRGVGAESTSCVIGPQKFESEAGKMIIYAAVEFFSGTLPETQKFQKNLILMIAVKFAPLCRSGQSITGFGLKFFPAILTSTAMAFTEICHIISHNTIHTSSIHIFQSFEKSLPEVGIVEAMGIAFVGRINISAGASVDLAAVREINVGCDLRVAHCQMLH